MKIYSLDPSADKHLYIFFLNSLHRRSVHLQTFILLLLLLLSRKLSALIKSCHSLSSASNPFNAINVCNRQIQKVHKKKHPE
uniref:Uncharacterized protein n=1 Tax=Gasterosteus aculeatus TaxID=69293 RepID=G3Q8B9_GASAC